MKKKLYPYYRIDANDEDTKNYFKFICNSKKSLSHQRTMIENSIFEVNDSVRKKISKIGDDVFTILKVKDTDEYIMIVFDIKADGDTYSINFDGESMPYILISDDKKIDRITERIKKEIDESPYQCDYLAGLYKALAIIQDDM